MSQEHGKLCLATNEEVKKDQFVLARVNRDVQDGDKVIQHETTMLYASTDASIGDRFVGIGIIRKECTEGKNILLIVNPEQEIMI